MKVLKDCTCHICKRKKLEQTMPPKASNIVDLNNFATISFYDGNGNFINSMSAEEFKKRFPVDLE